MSENKLATAMSETNVKVSTLSVSLRLKHIYFGNTLFLSPSK